MLILPELIYPKDKKLDNFVYNFITGAIKANLKDIIHSYESEEDVNDVFYSEDMLEDYFPENFPADNKEKMLETMKALYSLMISKDEWVPTLLMEYVLSKIIEFGIKDYEIFRDNVINDLINYGIIEDCEFESMTSSLKDTIFRKHYFDYLAADPISKQFIASEKKLQDKRVNIPFSNDTFNKLMGAYMSNYEDEGVFDEDDPEEEKREYYEELVNNIWHFSREWLEWCFWDWDFMCLDEMEMGELRHSFANKDMGILPEDSKMEEYFLPDDWEHSKDFRFIKE